MLDFLVHFLGGGDSLRNLLAEQLSEALPQPMHGLASRSLTHVQLSRRLGVRNAPAFRSQEGAQHAEFAGLAGSLLLCAQLGESAVQQRHGPMAVVEAVWREGEGGVRFIAVFGARGIEGQMCGRATAVIRHPMRRT